jgi:WD40 repeat protein
MTEARCNESRCEDVLRAEIFIGTYSGGVAKLEFCLPSGSQGRARDTVVDEVERGQIAREDPQSTFVDKTFGSTLHNAPVRSIKICEREQSECRDVFIATGSAAGEIVLVDPLQQRQVGELDGAVECVNDLAYATLGGKNVLIVAGGRSCGEISVWIEDAMQKHRWLHAGTLKICRGPVVHIGFFKNSTIFFTIDENSQLMLWNLSELMGPRLQRLHRFRRVDDSSGAAVGRPRCKLKIKMGFKPSCMDWCSEMGTALFCHQNRIEMHNLISRRTTAAELPPGCQITCVSFASNCGIISEEQYIILGTKSGTIFLAKLSSEHQDKQNLELIAKLSLNEYTERCRPEKVRNVGAIALTTDRLYVAALSSSKIYTCYFRLSGQREASMFWESHFGHRVTCSTLRSLREPDEEYS